ncbi:mRNA splicing factor [Niveomyces insectorum RCEF 264]|uniref:Pre-mRNA-splicing factor SLU7 n=1 Tax=Niveomyces insectorum RCEF 264 TaxID=1081102 RepID=A0A167W5F4_9HYPO|nr:mRNA splicing factor [Niveomyces insectorum RCEF 264]
MSLLGRQSPDPRDERLGGSRSGPARKEENIYIPQFITKRPFYAIDESDEGGAAAAAGAETAAVAAGGISRSGDRDYLEHQRLRKADETVKWYERGKKAGPAATKYRKGACENCGSMGHKKRDCLSRPRAKLAKYSGVDIQADEVVQDVQLTWDAKRDRWLGFDTRDYAAMMAQREKLNEARRALVEKGPKADGGGSGNDTSSSALTKTTGDGKLADLDDTRYAEDDAMGVSRTNGAADLRMREDTARYLVNLDLDSAKYDPKRRRIVSGGAFLDDSARLFAEQNFAKASGDAEAFEQAERYAWEMHDRTGDASRHVQANPTAAAHQRRIDREAAEAKQKELDALMREKYGVGVVDDGAAAAADGAATKPAAASRLPAVTASEHFVEYDEAGHVKDRLPVKRADTSKYAEDVFPMNHTAVWGSWWHDFQWGYACCHSFVRNSYCTGEEGKAAWERAERQRLGDWGDAASEHEGGNEGGGGDGDGGRKMLKERGEEGEHRDEGLSDEGRDRRESSPATRKKKNRTSSRTD